MRGRTDAIEHSVPGPGLCVRNVERAVRRVLSSQGRLPVAVSRLTTEPAVGLIQHRRSRCGNRRG
jgi:hypothetical protein